MSEEKSRKNISDSPGYLRKQMLEFREMMGNKKYWKLSDGELNRKIDLAFKGLFHLYIQTRNITDDDKMHMEAIMIEFERRRYYVEMKDYDEED